MEAWILIIILQGWGAGTGSTGNTATAVEFASKDKCDAAANEIRKISRSVSGAAFVNCFPK